MTPETYLETRLDAAVIREMVESLATRCLEASDYYHEYTDRDLMEATIIFSHFLTDVVYSQNKTLEKEKMLELGNTVGKAIRELIKASTGKDMHEIVKSL